jgi:hypothetical protein
VWFKWKTIGSVNCFREIAEATATDIDRALAADSFDKFALVATQNSLLHAWQPKPEDETYLRTRGGDPWVLLFHDGATRQHLRSATRLPLEQVRRSLQSFLSGGDDWRQVADWQALRVQTALGEHDSRAFFKWQGLEDWDASVYMAVTLDSPGFHAAATVCEHSDAVRLVRFLEEIGSLAGDWQRELQTWNLGVSCWGRADGDIGVELSLDQSVYDPPWTAIQRMTIATSAWSEIVEQFREYLAAAEGT